MSAILLVEDSPADRALFRTILGRAGFEVHEVTYGRDAVERAKDVRPHVVVLDVNLPDLDGHDVCRAIRAEDSLTGVPVLMLTVRDNEADILAGLDAGADDYVAKDANPEIILARVRRLVRYRQMAILAVLNEQLVQVGRLLAGVVHEIRGPLSVIRGNAELIQMTLDDDHPALARLDPIIRGCQLLQLRLEHLMAAVRGGPPVLIPLEINPVVREACELFLKGTDPRGHKVDIAQELPDGLPPVLADAGRIIQVLLNLLGNAREAVLSDAARDRGQIVITCRVQRDGDSPGVSIDVRDDGPGIPPAILGRIFEPFYTTKPTGSGYGLYLAAEILREHHGRLTACNHDTGGACFTLWLPISEGRPPS